MKEFPRIVFIGSTSFSLFSLKELYIHKYNIVGIITNPDPVSKKKKNIIKEYALENNIPFLQPKNLLDSSFLENLKVWKADIQIVVSFRILPKEVWKMPKIGTINLHASLLPQYRGAAPINWVIINGENQTGLTTFFVNDQVDCGKILFQKKIEIKKEETAGELENKLKKISGSMIIKTLEGIFQKRIKPKSQKTIIPLKYAPKIFTIDCRIFWQEPSINVIYNKIRGLSPYPSAWTLLFFKENKFVRFKIFMVKTIHKKHFFPIGLVIISSFEMKISVKEGFISIIEGQIEGKKKMNIKNLINGIKIRKNLFVR
ncbi:MAG: methionyl-tRNA formyltransferase [Flavobacteriales bacterium]|jgi:methionyl-tRNA formyltransferase|uniref:methionyl-tRNA formyltransferase n=1 Tax=Blattabacterium sp. (Mastotermes darwiniensis) TaxID=39768 RepID=UPI000231DF11|nr:methionyl-tRNA formyltransferase [Blattabacterium sp. (Mastotermes darwiniensis)]AER40837.1 Methionyl-tRNA formyltransferase [Blattabacterium sp. (Mastotermes darwiniensis) str. MADAR]MDR1804684.1 methionyl-tRNA formyltransferase [Flavobacteriales bacterium]